jgi:hypothetical protein
MTPSMIPQRPPRRRGKLRYVIIAVVSVVVLACGSGGIWAYKSLSNWFEDVSDGSSAADDGKFGPAGDLKQAGTASLPGNGSLTTAVANGVTYYAAVNGSSVEVAALGADGAEKWRKSYPVEPTELRITATGTLLHIDCEKAATHGGKNVRLVVDAATGDNKMLRQYDDERVTHFVGNDAFIEINNGSSNGRVQRVDLASGAVKWDSIVQPQRPSSFDILAVPAMVYAADGPTAQQGIPGPVSGLLNRAPTAPDFRQAVAVDPATFVGLDSVKGIATVYDASTGKARGSGAVPFDGEAFSVYQGVLVGRLDDKTSPGRLTVAGYGTDTFAKRWEVPLPAGARIEQIKPCGPQHMCVLYNANSTYTLISMDLKSSKEAWKQTFTSTLKPEWYLMKAGLLLGEWQIGNVGKPAMHDVATGAKKQALDGGITSVAAIAADDRWVLIRTIRYLGSGKGSVTTVAAVDVETGKLSSPLDVGKSADQIENASIAKGTVAVVSENRQLVIAQTPS